MDFLGAPLASVVLYLDNRPVIEQCTINNEIDVNQLIEDNGNHWRKIMTIFAKLSCQHLDKPELWRTYRDQELLMKQEQVCFSSTIVATAKVHFFSGKHCWRRFNILEDQQQTMKASSCGKLHYRFDRSLGLLLYTPYFDYRQFPNKLIAETIDIINYYQAS